MKRPRPRQLLACFFVMLAVCWGCGDDPASGPIEWSPLGELQFIVGANIVRFDGQDNVLIFEDDTTNSFLSRNIFRYDVVAGEWAQIETAGFHLDARGQRIDFFTLFDLHDMVTGLDGALYGFGGYTRDDVCRLIRLQPDSVTFEVLTTTPVPAIEGLERANLECGELVAVDAQGRAIVAGPNLTHLTVGDERRPILVGVHRFDPSSGTWTVIDDTLQVHYFRSDWLSAGVFDGAGNVYFGIIDGISPRGLYVLSPDADTLRPVLDCATGGLAKCRGFERWYPFGAAHEGVWISMTVEGTEELRELNVTDGEVVNVVRFPEHAPDGTPVRMTAINVLAAPGHPKLPQQGTLYATASASTGGLLSAHSLWRKRPGREWELIDTIDSSAVSIYGRFHVSPLGQLYRTVDLSAQTAVDVAGAGD